jgi:enoyl-CoA hydratase
MSLVLVDRGSDGVVTVTLNRPESLNALSWALMGELMAAFRAVGDDPDVACVILTGAGRAFCAGVDLAELGSLPEGGVDTKMGSMAALRECPVPVIAAVNGVAVTAGLELALACDILIASSGARFADTHARVGVLPRWGLTQQLTRLVGYSRARELSFSGAFLDAETAETWGLVNRVVEPGELMPHCLRLAGEIAGNDRRALRALKGVYREGDTTLAEGIAIELRAGDAFNSTVPQSEVARRRAGVQARNRGGE